MFFAERTIPANPLCLRPRQTRIQLRFGFSADDAFIEGLLDANKIALMNQGLRHSVSYSLPHGLLKLLSPVILQAATSRPAWFEEEANILVEHINRLARAASIPNLPGVLHSSALVEHLKAPYESSSWNAIYVPPTRTLEATGTIAT